MGRTTVISDDGGPPDTGDEAWLLVSAALVFMMTPALAMFYGGMVSPRAVVSTMLLSFVCLSVGSVVWSLLGYSIAFGPPVGGTDADALTGSIFSGGIFGDLAFGAFDSSDRTRSGVWPVSEHAFFSFQLAFNTITIAVISGAVVERIQLWAFVVFSVFWTLLVYCPLARWVFYPGGWLARWGVLDFAGGLVVETASGVSAFVLAFWLGPGQTLHGGHAHRPHNIPFVLLGAGLLWVGWFGFNAGSAVVSGYLSGRAFANTHLAASAAMATWSLAEIALGGEKWFSGRPTAFGAATGAVVGLVAITPACGYVSQMVSLLIGFVCAITSYWAARGLKASGVDDRLECLPCHGVAGMMGIIFTGLFANVNEDAPTNGAFYGNGELLGKQLGGLGVTLLMTTIGTSVCYWLVWCIGFLLRIPIRVPDEVQHEIDAQQHGELAYHHLETPTTTSTKPEHVFGLQ